MSINRARALHEFNIAADAGGTRRAIVREFTIRASESGAIVVTLVKGFDDQPKISDIEVRARR